MKRITSVKLAILLLGASAPLLLLTPDGNGGGIGQFTASDAYGHTVRGRATLDRSLLIGAPLRERSSCGPFWNCMKVTFRIG